MSHLLELNEQVIDALVAKLQDGLPAAIDEINARDTKGIELNDVAQVLDYVPTPAMLNRFPTIAIGDGASDLEDDVGFGATGVHRLSIVCFVADADQRRLAVALRRYVRAALSVAIWQRSIGPAWGVQVLGVQPGPTLGRSEDPREWMSYAAASIACRTEEDTPA